MDKNNDFMFFFTIYFMFTFILLPFIAYMYNKPKGMVFIVRGLQGSGKTFYANKLVQWADPDSTIEIDMYKHWNNNGNKRQHYIQLLKCWNNSLIDYTHSMKKEEDPIVVNNPCITKWEYEIYKELAKKHNYSMYVYQ